MSFEEASVCVSKLASTVKPAKCGYCGQSQVASSGKQPRSLADMVKPILYGIALDMKVGLDLQGRGETQPTGSDDSWDED